MACPVCGQTNSEVFLQRDSVPVGQNLLLASADEARLVPRGRLELACCLECGFVYNQAYDEHQPIYTSAYENSQTHSSVFVEHIEKTIEHIVDTRGVRDSLVVEVGCGQGDYLRRLIDHDSSGNTGYGFDPAYRGDAVSSDGRLRFVNDFFTEKDSGIKADAVVSRHVIEHISKPIDFLVSIRLAVSLSHSPVVFFETPCVEWILEKGVIWDFFYEHCSYFSSDSIKRAFSEAGLVPIEVTHMFGGQYMMAECTTGNSSDNAKNTANAERIIGLAQSFARYEYRKLDYWTSLIQKSLVKGQVCVWGAGAKGVTFCNLVDPEAKTIDCVVDINPLKQGGYLSGTGHAIVCPASLSARSVKTVLVLNPNYLDEIQKTIDECSPGSDVISLMDIEEDAAHTKS